MQQLSEDGEALSFCYRTGCHGGYGLFRGAKKDRQTDSGGMSRYCFGVVINLQRSFLRGTRPGLVA